DLKVFGFDDTIYATLSTPTISTVAQPRRDLGLESARILLNMINDPDAPQKSLLLPARLKIREST
ncbi:MAG: substrate-binding domain-containing protein, partial [Clostridiales bacterium]|nr:substrate-binding domain-containing protein [Clostridiales bacterium]